MLLIANFINAEQHMVDQTNTFPVVVVLGREKRRLGSKKNEKGNVTVKRDIKEIYNTAIHESNGNKKGFLRCADMIHHPIFG